MNSDDIDTEPLRVTRAPLKPGKQSSRARRPAATVVRRAVIVVVLIGGIFFLLNMYSGIRFTDTAAVRQTIDALGPAGPVFIITLIAAAIVMTPVPSAPIALAAGAAYGHVWGTLYVALGAEIGALAAFGIARFVGYEAVMARIGPRLASMRLFGSQSTLMAIVFSTRLVPFISFDIVSYAAGLTPLTMWRFALATLLGILPASFVLAHIGGEITSADPTRILGAVLALGIITGAPLLVAAVKRQSRKTPRSEDELT